MLSGVTTPILPFLWTLFKTLIFIAMLPLPLKSLVWIVIVLKLEVEATDTVTVLVKMFIVAFVYNVLTTRFTEASLKSDTNSYDRRSSYNNIMLGIGIKCLSLLSLLSFSCCLL